MKNCIKFVTTCERFNRATHSLNLDLEKDPALPWHFRKCLAIVIMEVLFGPVLSLLLSVTLSLSRSEVMPKD
jgi:hypothetical protein